MFLENILIFITQWVSSAMTMQTVRKWAEVDTYVHNYQLVPYVIVITYLGLVKPKWQLP